MKSKRFMPHAILAAVSLLVVGFVAGCPNTSGALSALTSLPLFSLTHGAVQGPVSISPSGLLAFSNGTDIFTLDLNNPSTAPVQVTSNTNGIASVAPSFLSNGQLVFATTDPATPNQLQLLSASPGTQLGTPAPISFGTVNATDLGLSSNTILTAPTSLNINPGGVLGTGVINNEPFLFNFGGSTVGVTSLNNSFGFPVNNPVLSPNLSQLAFTNSAGQVGVVAMSNGTFEPSNVVFVGNGTFPSFTPTGQLTFFNTNGLNIGNGTTITNGAQNTFSTFPLSADFLAASPAFASSGSSFITTNAAGTGFIQTSIPSTTLPEG